MINRFELGFKVGRQVGMSGMMEVSKGYDLSGIFTLCVP